MAVDGRVAEHDDGLADFGASPEDELLAESKHGTTPRALIDPNLDLRGNAEWKGERHGQRDERHSNSCHECTALPNATWLSAVPNATHARHIRTTTAKAYTASGSITACHTMRVAFSIASARYARGITPLSSRVAV